MRYFSVLDRDSKLLVLAGLVALCLSGCGRDSGDIQYISFARIVAQPPGAPVAEGQPGVEEFYGTQMALIQSGKVRRRAHERVDALSPELSEVPVVLEVTRTRNSSIINLQAVASEPGYTRAYLDAILEEYLNFRKEMGVDGKPPALKSLEEQLLKLERELAKAEGDLQTAGNSEMAGKLRKNVENMNTTYRNLLMQLRESDLGNNASKSHVSIMEQATAAVLLERESFLRRILGN